MVDRLNIKYRIGQQSRSVWRRHPELLSKYERDLFYEKDYYDD